MRIYARNEVCGFRHSAAQWGELSNFFPLAVPIAAGPMPFRPRLNDGNHSSTTRAAPHAAHAVR